MKRAIKTYGFWSLLFCALLSVTTIHAAYTTDIGNRSVTNLAELVKIESNVPPATFTFANRKIITLRATVSGNTPVERLDGLEDIIKERYLSGESMDLSMVTAPGGIYIIRMGKTGILVLSDKDFLPEQAKYPVKSTREVMARLKEAIQVWENRNRPEILLRGFGFSLMGILACGLILTLIWRIERRTEKRITGKSRVVVDGVDIVETSGLHQVTARLVRYLVILISLVILYIAIQFSLRQFPYTRPLGDTLRNFLFGVLNQFAVAIKNALPGLFIAAVIFGITRMITRMVRAVLQAVAIRQRGRDSALAETAQPTARIATLLIWMFAFVLAYPYLPGSQSLAFKGLSVFTGLILSIGASGLVNQAMGGLVVMYSRALRPGDWIQAGNVEGLVTNMGMLSTKVKTPRNEEITIPNAVLVTTQINNFTRMNKKKGMVIHTAVTIGYDTPWRQVHAILKEAADRTKLIRKKPEPVVLQTALADYYVEYRLQAYMDKPLKKPAVLSELHEHIQDVFNEYGVQIMSPHYINDPDAPLVVPKDQWYEAPAKRPETES